MKRKSRLRIHGNDRLLMMLCKDVRRRWLQYGENRKLPEGKCNICKKEEGIEIDHIEPVGPRPRTILTLSNYVARMVELSCQRLCKECHFKKTTEDRKRRKNV